MRMAEMGGCAARPAAAARPDMENEEERRHPLVDSEWGFVEASLKLKADKAYENDEDDW